MRSRRATARRPAISTGCVSALGSTCWNSWSNSCLAWSRFDSSTSTLSVKRSTTLSSSDPSATTSSDSPPSVWASDVLRAVPNEAGYSNVNGNPSRSKVALRRRRPRRHRRAARPRRSRSWRPLSRWYVIVGPLAPPDRWHANTFVMAGVSRGAKRRSVIERRTITADLLVDLCAPASESVIRRFGVRSIVFARVTRTFRTVERLRACGLSDWRGARAAMVLASASGGNPAHSRSIGRIDCPVIAGHVSNSSSWTWEGRRRLRVRPVVSGSRWCGTSGAARPPEGQRP